MSNQPNTEEMGQHFLNQPDANKQGMYELSEAELENIAGGGMLGDIARFLHIDGPIHFVADGFSNAFSSLFHTSSSTAHTRDSLPSSGHASATHSSSVPTNYR